MGTLFGDATRLSGDGDAKSLDRMIGDAKSRLTSLNYDGFI